LPIITRDHYVNVTKAEMETRKFVRIFVKSLLGSILLLSLQSQAQENEVPMIPFAQDAGKDTVKTSASESGWLPTTSLYLELGGKVFYSLNVDFRKKENLAFSLGASYFPEDGNSDTESQSMIFTSVMGYYLTGKRHRIELGGGLCPGFGTSEGLAAMAVYGNAGYRYQKKKGLIFRVAFTPFMGIPVSKDDSFVVMPWAAISLGYSF
jgi:hypothetical protein